MFFLIGGVQPRTVWLEKQARPCPSCGHLDVYVKRVDHYLSLFFIPLIRVKKGVPFAVCRNCQAILRPEGGEIHDEQRGHYRRCRCCGRSVAHDFSFCPYCGKHL